ncbi:MAG: hypothetical protein O3A47_03575 [Chloroflexi bacterium]|nr:hypothetical protein [Chloroflexota bacterium]
MFRRYLSGIYGLPPEDIETESVDAFLGNYHNRTAINVAYPVPHGALRISTVGFHDRPLRGQDLESARALVAEAMKHGAIGLSTGMSYFPNSWSDTEELIELCKVVARLGGVYITHLRDVHTERGFGGGGVTEALEIGRRSGVKVHFSHYRTANENAGEVERLMEDIDRAEAEGVDCTLELYPFPTGSGYPMMFLLLKPTTAGRRPSWSCCGTRQSDAPLRRTSTNITPATWKTTRACLRTCLRRTTGIWKG